MLGQPFHNPSPMLCRGLGSMGGTSKPSDLTKNPAETANGGVALVQIYLSPLENSDHLVPVPRIFLTC